MNFAGQQQAQVKAPEADKYDKNHAKQTHLFYLGGVEMLWFGEGQRGTDHHAALKVCVTSVFFNLGPIFQLTQV